MEDQWGKDIPRTDPDVLVSRNKTADRYLEAFERYGKEGITVVIMKEEAKG